MNLICPHCQKKVTVPESLGGQTTTCTYCSGPFTVPMPPGGSSSFNYSSGSSYANRSAGSAAVLEHPASAPPTNSQSEPDLPPLPSPTHVGEYRRHVRLPLNPTAVRWVAPVCVIFIFLFQFVPWVGVYAGNETIARQLGVSVAFGSVRTHISNYVPALNQMSATALGLFFFLMLIGFFLAIGFIFLATASPSVKANIPPWVNQITPWRAMIFGGLCSLAFLFLLPYTVVDFPFEAKVTENAETVYQGVIKAADDLKVPRSEVLGTQILQRRGWFGFVVLLNLVAVAGAAADFWLERRAHRPLPRLTVEW